MLYKTKRSYWKSEDDICEENTDMGKSCKGKTLPNVKQRETKLGFDIFTES